VYKHSVLRTQGNDDGSDIRLLEQTLHDDAQLEMTPARTWFSGRATCLPYLATVIGEYGEWSARATRANGQPAAIAYRRGEPFAVVVLGLRDERIGRISLFGDPTVIHRFHHQGVLTVSGDGSLTGAALRRWAHWARRREWVAAAEAGADVALASEL